MTYISDVNPYLQSLNDSSSNPFGTSDSSESELLGDSNMGQSIFGTYSSLGATSSYSTNPNVFTTTSLSQPSSSSFSNLVSKSSDQELSHTSSNYKKRLKGEWVDKIRSMKGASIGKKIVAAAAHEIGIGKDSNSGERYGESAAWCAAFATTMYRTVTGKSSTPIGNSHCVYELIGTAKKKGLFTSSKNSKGFKQGNFIFFRHGAQYHVGIVSHVDKHGRVHTIEGNTSDKVRRRVYSAHDSSIVGYGRVAA